jgi:small subunit ribosomal protein S12
LNERFIWIIAKYLQNHTPRLKFKRNGSLLWNNFFNVLIGFYLTNIYFLICVFLTTIIQSIKKNKIYKNSNFSRTPALCKRPQVKGIVNLVTTMKPKKPNSAVRHIAKIKLTNEINLTARVPGIDYRCSKYNRVLVHGGRANDLPGVGYTVIRGVYDFSSVIFKRKRRSIYGTPRSDSQITKKRRCFRNPIIKEEEKEEISSFFLL